MTARFFLKSKNIIMKSLYYSIFTYDLLFTSCAPSTIEECINDPCGFVAGIWHGTISPLTLVVSSFFCNDISIYAVNNNGEWYNSGFIIGAFFGIFFAYKILGDHYLLLVFLIIIAICL